MTVSRGYLSNRFRIYPEGIVPLAIKWNILFILLAAQVGGTLFSKLDRPTNKNNKRLKRI
jgi:hypothetical protein